jgi:hypothetical protein
MSLGRRGIPSLLPVLDSRGLSSDQEGDAKLWRSLWAVETPEKMKITDWRFAHDCLPSGHQLLDPRMMLCFSYGCCERIEHTILLYQFAREVWEAVLLEHQLNHHRKFFTSTRTWTMYCMGRASD